MGQPRGRSRHRVVITPKESLAARRAMLETLAANSRNKKSASEWMFIGDAGEGMYYPVAIARTLKRLGLIECAMDSEGGGEIARITQHGLWALENQKLTHAALTKSAQIPIRTYQVLEGIARRMGIKSVVQLLGKMATRGEGLERWFRFQWPEEK